MTNRASLAPTPEPNMTYLVLLGDSIFDNAAYVDRGPAGIDQVRQHLRAGWTATLLAVDGDTSAEVSAQIRRLPHDATHLVLSVGGNDALGTLTQMGTPAGTLVKALDTLTAIQAGFQASYRSLVAKLLVLNKPLMVCCTVYDQVPGLPTGLRTALGLFNDVILRTAIQHRLPVLDLRMICTDAEDYSVISPIEPSCQGGAKIAERMVVAVVGQGSATKGCQVHW